MAKIFEKEMMSKPNFSTPGRIDRDILPREFVNDSHLRWQIKKIDHDLEIVKSNQIATAIFCFFGLTPLFLAGFGTYIFAILITAFLVFVTEGPNISSRKLKQEKQRLINIETEIEYQRAKHYIDNEMNL